MKDHYSNLEINRDLSTPAEIKKAYRRLILKWHPDKNNNSLESTQVFQEIQEAFEILGSDEKKKVYDFKFRSSVNNIGYFDNIDYVVLKRFKLKSIENINKELKIFPEVKIEEFEDLYLYYRNFKEKINSFTNEYLCSDFSDKLILIIKSKRNRKLEIIELDKKRKETISSLRLVIEKYNDKASEIDFEEYLEIFSDNCNCRISLNYKKDYHFHIEKCLLSKESIEKFSLSLTEKLKEKEGKINKFRIAIISEIEEEIEIHNKETNWIFSSKIQIDWKEEILRSDRNRCFSIKNILISEIEESKEEYKKIKTGKDKVKVRVGEREEKNIEKNSKFEKELTWEDLKEIAQILNISRSDFSYEKIKTEVRKLKLENNEYKKANSFKPKFKKFENKQRDEKEILKSEIFEKRKELNNLKNTFSVNLNSENKFILNNRLFFSLERKLNRTDWKKYHESNVKNLEVQIKKEDLEKILKIMKEIIEMEKKLVLSIKSQESEYQFLQEQKDFKL